MWQARGMKSQVNPLNAELNPICHLLELLGAHSILHVSRIWVKLALTIAIRNDRVFMELTHLYSTFPHNQRNPVNSMLQVSWQWQQILNRLSLARPVCTVIRTEPLGPTATKNCWGGAMWGTQVFLSNVFRANISFFFVVNAMHLVCGKFSSVSFTLTREQHCSPFTCLDQCASHTFMHKANFNWNELATRPHRPPTPTPPPPQLTSLYLAGLA